MGLVNWWTLNGTLNDCKNGNALVAGSDFNSNGAGKIGNCYYASTTSAYAQSANTIMIDGSMSICCWFKQSSVSKNPNALVTLHDHSDTSNIGLNLRNDKLSVSIGYTDGTREYDVRYGTTSIAANTWYHAALTFDKTSNRITLYLNGVKEYSGVLTKTVKHVAKKLTVNRWSVNYTADYISPCYYNDIRLYNHELSYKEVKEIAKGLMIHYTCNPSATAGKYRDSSGYKYHAIATNHPTFSRDDSAMGTASYLFINGSKQSNEQYQYFKSENTIRVPESGTMSYYLKQSGTQNSDNHYAVGFQNFCSINGFGSGNEVGLIYYHESSSYTTKTNTATIRDGNWHMYTISWTVNGTLKIYIDGALIGSHTIGAMVHAGTFRTFVVGSAWDYGYGGYSGYIDDVKLYATQLSDADVLELYQAKASVSKNGKLFVNEICETNLVTKEAYSAKWTRIFYHNNKSGTVLFGSDKNEFLSCHTTDKISDLWALERFRDKDGKFELLLEYGDETGYNRWKQTSDFTKTTAITGYEAVACSWTGNAWGGLALSQDSATWVDGSPNSGSSSWWYAIGSKSVYQGGIPGGTKAVTGTASLWVRTDNVSSVKVTKKGIVYATEINEVDNTSMKTKTELNANWVRLFYHNNKAGTVLFSSDKKEFLKCNTGDKISDLWALEQFRGKDGKFELLLQYETGGSAAYNRWKQSSNFIKEAIAGYEAVYITWTTQGWGGLEISPNASTWVDGTVGHDNWYYAIGAKAVYNGGIPSYDTETGWVELWVRCDDINLFRMIKGGKCKATEFIEN